MEERCFIVKKENHIYKDYFEWWNNRENLKNKWKQFKKLEGIEANCFVEREELYIIPEGNDLNKFGKMFVKQVFNQGLRKFKANSPVQKDWEKFITNNKVLVRKPDFVIEDFVGKCVCGHITSRLFHYKDTVYCSINADFYSNDSIPEGYEEIKKSEFYKIIEEIENG